MLPSGPNATLAGTVSPPKLPLGSNGERLLSAASANVSDCCGGRISIWSNFAARQLARVFAREPARPLSNHEVGSCGGCGIGGSKTSCVLNIVNSHRTLSRQNCSELESADRWKKATRPRL